jgi:hypothetical protein
MVRHTERASSLRSVSLIRFVSHCSDVYAAILFSDANQHVPYLCSGWCGFMYSACANHYLDWVTANGNQSWFGHGPYISTTYPTLGSFCNHFGPPASGNPNVCFSGVPYSTNSAATPTAAGDGYPPLDICVECFTYSSWYVPYTFVVALSLSLSLPSRANRNGVYGFAGRRC